MDFSTRLPESLSTRPLTHDDLQDVYEVTAAQELADVGEVVVELADIAAEWQRPGLSLGDSSVGVFDQGRLVGYAELNRPDRYEVAVLPPHNGRGIGTWLAAWARARAVERGSTVIGMPVPQGSPGDRLLESLGYYVRWTSWVLRLPDAREVEPQPLPAGYLVRAVAPQEHGQVWKVVEDAFLEWSVRDRETFAEFESQVFHRPGYEPWQVRVSADPSGDVVGVAFVTVSGADAFVQKLAVRKDQRGRGLARALLVDAFDQGRAHGCTRFELSTDSRTGALGLYERVGMVVADTWVHRAVDLRPEL